MSLSRRIVRAGAVVALALVASGWRGCGGYEAVTKGGLPKQIRTVAVPPFQNQALRYKIESRFTGAVMQELIRRGHGLRVQPEREGADAVVDGVIRNFYFSGVLLDRNGRARIFEVTITGAVTVRDQTTNRVLYDNQNYVYRGEFEFTSDPRSFFNEEDPAVERLSRKFAEDLVSTLVNGFGVNEKK
ncbi:MAG: LPS assembly lipoprotein LptE [Pyrinomonadaceae bacterium]